MNGDEAVKLKNYDDGQWRVYIASKIDVITKAVEAQGNAVAAVVEKQHEYDLKLVELPDHCVHEKDFQKMCNLKTELDGRLDELEKDKAGRTAVNKFLFGASGFSVIAIIIMMLKVFEVF